MSTAHDSLRKASFAGVPFPVSEVEVKGGLRDHVHEYPKKDGGDPELLGRKLYTVRMKALFHRTFSGYAGLYPGGLDKLWDLLDASTIGELIIPGLGSMQAYAPDWTRRLTARVRSGQSLDLEFREVPDEPIVIELHDIAQRPVAAVARLVDEAGKVPGLLEVLSRGLADLQSAVNSVTSALDTAEMYGNLLEAKVLQVGNIIGELNRIDKMQESRSYPAWTALQDVATSTNALLNNLLGGQQDLHEFVVPGPGPMSVQMISVNIFGDATHAMDIMNLNPIEDAFAVPPGFVIRYYPKK